MNKATQKYFFLYFSELAFRLYKSVDYWYRYAELSEL